MVRRADVKVGDRVTVKRYETGYYSDYGGNPPFGIEPGRVGVVGAVGVPYVREKRPGEDRSEEFVCVDFFLPDGRAARDRLLFARRAGVDYKNLRVLPAETPITDKPEGELAYFCGGWCIRTKGE